MLFFSNYRMDKKHLDMIINDRKIIIKHKEINYGDIQKHLINYDKPMRINRDDDEILKDIKENILPPFDYIDVDADGDEIIYNANYIWGDLLPSTKQYLRSNDKKFSIFDYVHYDSLANNTSNYDFREQRFLKLYKDLETIDYNEFNDLYERCVVGGAIIPTPTENKVYMSSRRAYKQVKSLALCNCNEFKYFLTFTFADEDNKEKHLIKNKEREKGENEVKFRYATNDRDLKTINYTNFMDNFKRKVKKKFNIELKYITVPELHKNGDIHFHTLISDFPQELTFKMPKWLDYDHVKHRYNNGYGFLDWKYGKSDLQLIKHKESVSTYIAKYMLKNFQEIKVDEYELYINKKRYFPSMNLIKPIEKYLDDDEYEKQFKKVCEETYKEEYHNPYNDSNIQKYILPI